MRPVHNYRMTISFVFLLLGIVFSANAQTLKEMFSDSGTPVFYYGIDFSKAKLIDDPAANASDIRDNKYTAINQLIITEAEKYDLKSSFNRTVDHDLSAVNKRNESANAEAIISTTSADFHRFKESDIDAMVKSFDGGGKKAIGLLFIVEAMSKSEKAMAVWVTLFDPKTKKVLMTERMEGKAAGFGFRNYWAGAIKDVLTDIKKKKYSEWKTKYGG